MSFAGKFIVIDGPDGAGKGTQLDRLAAWLAAAAAQVRRARDPGGTEIGDRIRHVLLGYDLSPMDPHCETLLFMASRAQLVAEIIRPALSAGETVLCDRYISATCAYQAAAGIDVQEILTLSRIAVGPTWPDLTIILDLPPEVGFARTGRKPHHVGRRDDPGQRSMFDGATADAMERRPLEYHRQVREQFLALPKLYPTPVEIVNADRSADLVWVDVQRVVEQAFGSENVKR